MNPYLTLLLLIGYFGALVVIAHFTSKSTQSLNYFKAGGKVPWYVVAFGMIGSSLSGVTFVSVPGWVAGSSFGYMQIVLGYLLGYALIGWILMPLYYRLNLVSIYGYLKERFGIHTYKTGAVLFLVSRLVGSTLRLYLVAKVLQVFIFDAWNVPFAVTALVTIALIYVYTYKGGIGTIVWTDTLQTACMILALVFTVHTILNSLDWGMVDLATQVVERTETQIFFWDWSLKTHFFKQFLGGALIALSMTGLDQDMMQKNLSCKNLWEAQKNLISFSIGLVVVNFFFLCLGFLLFEYAKVNEIMLPMEEGKLLADKVYPFLAKNHLGMAAGLFFILGIIAAAYSSADSALTALTTSLTVDIMGMDPSDDSQKAKSIRWKNHLGLSVIMGILLMFFYVLNRDSIIDLVFKAAGYTYGPLLGLYILGLYSKVLIRDSVSPWACFIAPFLTYWIQSNSVAWIGYEFGYELLLLNALLTIALLLVGDFLLKRFLKRL